MPDDKCKGLWIPIEILDNEELSLQEKIVFTKVCELDKAGGCYASNKYFSKLLKLTPHRCSQIVNNLIKKEYVSAKYEYEGKEIKKRVLKIFNRGIKYLAEGIKDMSRGYSESVKVNNKLNNKVNNKKKRTPSFIKPSTEEIQKYITERNITHFTAESFYDFYESKGWMVGKNKMKDWKAAVRTWEKRNAGNNNSSTNIQEEIRKSREMDKENRA